MSKLNLDKNTLFSILLILVAAAIVYRLIPVRVDPVLTLVISKNQSGITNISQTRDISTTKQVKVDILNFAEKSRFMHPKLGDVGYGTDFFVDVNAPFTVKETGNYVFYVASDDGFILNISGKEICRYPSARGLASQLCNIHLTEGQHEFQLNYYQGYGHAGLKVEYGKAGNSKRYWVGESSPFIRFK